MRCFRWSTVYKECSTKWLRIQIPKFAQTVSDPDMRLRGDLPKSRVRLLDWCANPAPSCGFDSCRNSMTARTLRRVSALRPAPSSCRNSKTARTLRRVSALWPAASSCRDHGSNRGLCRPVQSADPTLLSLLWYKPGVRLPPRVANMVQTRGETLVGKPVDVSVSIG